ncbi:RING-H2 finger protein ATL72 [Musa troglodytarum]|uniref:RING-H2 finger protein ATL72 n=1 Tax=Musa troglodytarum TaxID=320322 RepID=A0A9E7JKF9_9LILI|nr:RING-H2 finger protein ATL72 [Musa troglodytarum]
MNTGNQGTLKPQQAYHLIPLLMQRRSTPSSGRIRLGFVAPAPTSPNPQSKLRRHIYDVTGCSDLVREEATFLGISRERGREEEERRRDASHRPLLLPITALADHTPMRMPAMRRLLDTVLDPPPLLSDGATPGDAGGASDAYFTTSVPVVLAALLCALVCALGMGSILRCAIRCARPRLALETPAATAATGLEKKALRQIPTMVYGPEAGVTATECPICLGEFGDGEKVRVLPKCHHGFHVRCIDAWLALQPSCPTCRRSLLDQCGAEAGDGTMASL